MKRAYKSGAQKRSDKKRKDDEFQQVLAKNKSMYDFINRPTTSTQQQKQHDQTQASEIQTLESVVVLSPVASSSTDDVEETLTNQPACLATDDVEETLTNQPACIAINCPSPPASLNSDQKRFILSTPPSQPPGPFPKDRKGRCFSDYHYHFLSASVRMQRKWLCYSSEDNFVYCRYCWLFGDAGDLTYQSSWVSGINDWQQLSKKIKKHESSPCHIKASFTAVEWMHDQTIDKSVEASKQKQINFWMEVVERLIKIVLLLARNNLAFRGHREKLGTSGNGNFLQIVELLASYDDVLKQLVNKSHSNRITYLSPQIQNELISLLARNVRSTITSEIRDAPYFAIMLDTTQDISKVDQLSMVIRYLTLMQNNENGASVPVCKVNERFLGFIELKDQTSEGIKTELLAFLLSHGILLNKCRGQCYDGAATMSGVYNGVQKRILDQQPNAFYVHCAAHNLNLIINDAVRGVEDISKFFDTVQSIYTFFGYSIRQWNLLADISSESVVTLKKLNPVRWSSRVRSLLALKHRYADVLKACVKIALESKNRDELLQATALKKKLESFEFVVILVMMSYILNVIDLPSKLLQGTDMDISKACNLLSQAKLQLCTYRSNFSALMKEAKEIGDRWGVVTSFSRKRIPVVKRQFDELSIDEARLSQSPEDRFRSRVFYAVIDIASSQISSRFQSFYEVVGKFDLLHPQKLLAMSEKELQVASQNLIQIYPELEPSFYFELLQLRMSFENEIKNEPTMTIREFAELLFVTYHSAASAFPNVLTTLFIFLTLPVTTAAAERSFSKLKLIKNYLRSQMSQERLDDLAVLSIESDIAEQMNHSAVAKSFANAKVRKVSFYV